MKPRYDPVTWSIIVKKNAVETLTAKKRHAFARPSLEKVQSCFSMFWIFQSQTQLHWLLWSNVILAKWHDQQIQGESLLPKMPLAKAIRCTQDTTLHFNTVIVGAFNSTVFDLKGSLDDKVLKGIYACRLNCPNLTRSFQNLHPRFAAGTSAVEPPSAEVAPDKHFHEPVVSWVKEYCIDHESQNPRCFHFQIVLRNFKSFSNLRWGIPTSKKNLMFFCLVMHDEQTAWFKWMSTCKSFQSVCKPGEWYEMWGRRNKEWRNNQFCNTHSIQGSNGGGNSSPLLPDGSARENASCGRKHAVTAAPVHDVFQKYLFM